MTIEILADTFSLSGSMLSIELTADSLGLTECRLLPAIVIPETYTSNPHLLYASAVLRNYFSGSPNALDAERTPDGTHFQKSVWDATLQIPYGEVRSYAWVAERIGRPKAVRAVANALGANPLLLFVPCHRVVRNNGDIGGFGCGIEIKRRLLALEGISSETSLKDAGALL